MRSAEADLQVGDRVRLAGGYDQEPRWLSGKPFVEGVVAGFISGQGSKPAAVIRLDAPLRVQAMSGKTLILELRYADAKWAWTETVHVELCDFSPEPKRWQERRQGQWVESHATYHRIDFR